MVGLEPPGSLIKPEGTYLARYISCPDFYHSELRHKEFKDYVCKV